jgi:transposase
MHARVVGVDLGDRKSHYCTLNNLGKVASEGSLPSTPTDFYQRFAKLPPSLIALEVGTHSRWASKVLKTCGHEVVVANTARVRLIHQNTRKSDRFDAKALAKLARVDCELLSPIQHRSDDAQARLAIIRARDLLVRTRSSVMNCVRGLVKPTGSRLPSCTPECFHVRVASALPKELRPALEPLLEQIKGLNHAILKYDHMMEDLADHAYPHVRLLTQIHGVGTLTALAFILTIEDPKRFRSSRDAGCYFGLQPKRYQSGDSDPELGIGKNGDEYMRCLLINAAHHILGPYGKDSDLRRWGLHLASRGGKSARKKAATAVARKLATVMHSIWTTGEVYDPLRNAAASKIAA